MDIFHEFFNAGENCITISNNSEVVNEIHGPYIKPSSWNRNRIQQPIRSRSRVFAPLAHATTLDALFHIGYYTWLPHTMNKSLECFMNAQVARKVTEMKLRKYQLLQPTHLGYDQLITASTWVEV